MGLISMPGKNIRGILLLAAGALVLALVGVAGVIHREGGTRGISPSAAAVQPSALLGNSNAVIRFVKNPELAPAFAARDITGKAVSKADWAGKVVLVNFWATWCPPCREEIPELIELQKQYKDRLEIVGISEDDDPPAKVLKFAQPQGMNYPIVMSTPELIDSYGGVPALPTTYLIDTQGRVVQKHSGLYPIDSYHAEIRWLLGLSTNDRIETFEDTGQIFLKNAANATDLPGVDFKGLNADQKKVALHRMNAESCTCGCKLTVSQCRVNDTECPVSTKIAAQIVEDASHGVAAAPSSAGVHSITQ
jgi:thiol-disulfide isomerase/thioredoxin